MQDLFDKFKNLIVESDKICNMEERLRFIMLEENVKHMDEMFDGLKKSENWIKFGVALRILNKITEDIPIPLFKFLPSKENCQAIKKFKSEIEKEIVFFDFKRANRIFVSVKYNPKNFNKYTDRHRLIESAMKLVMDHFEERQSMPWKWKWDNPTGYHVSCFIARCFLLRSRLALPKGSSIPEKKIEAIKKAWDWADSVYKNINNLKIEIALERHIWDPNLDENWVKNLLLKYIKELNTIDFSKPIHWAVYDYVQKQNLSHYNQKVFKEADDKILNFEKKRTGIHYPLIQTRAALRMGKTEILKSKLNKTVDCLENVPISKPLWNDTMSIMDEIVSKGDYDGIWEKSAEKAWEICTKQESQFNLSIQLRWYWSRVQQLYDFAFQAALKSENNLLAAEIADSLKSRPIVKLQEIEKYLTDQEDRETLNKIYESDILYALEDFMPGVEKIKQVVKNKSYKDVSSTRNISNVPDGWAALHFKIINSKEAVIIIITKKVDEAEANAVKRDIKGVLAAFTKWNQNNKNRKDHEILKELCRAIGAMLEPIVQKLESLKIDKLILIPHGFLHRVPIHAAIIKDEKMFFQKFQCIFLPSWALAPDEMNSKVLTEKKFLFKNWDDPIGDEILKGWDNRKQTNDTTEDVNQKEINDTAKDVLKIFEQITTPPELLVIFSHGIGDVNNPYNSRFKMYGSVLTHQMILKALKKDSLKNSKVILTACESDLVTSKFDMLDEHLSLTSAFLRKGANEIIGTLFECKTSYSKELILSVKNDKEQSLCEILTQKQKDWFEKKENNWLRKIAVFRTVGFPIS